jgi:hypothetical protein
LSAVTEHVTSIADIAVCLAKHRDRKWKYIYLDAHADRLGFGSADNKLRLSWIEFASALCQAHCLEEDAILFLACCRGGLRSTADLLFDNCDQIAFVCGPHWKITSYDLPVAFHVLIYNLESRNEEPRTAVRRASKALGFRFMFYDRADWEDTIYYDGSTHDLETTELPSALVVSDESACCPGPTPMFPSLAPDPNLDPKTGQSKQARR